MYYIFTSKYYCFIIIDNDHLVEGQLDYNGVSALRVLLRINCKYII